MAAANNQDFVTYQGDNVQPIFTVRNAAGVALDISAAAEITWTARRSLNDPVAIIKTKSGGGITFTNIGTDGKFTLTLTATDTLALAGWYMHYASITDGSGRTTTVTVGRMEVGSTPNWTFDDAAAATEQLYLVRAMIGDTKQSDQLVSDQLISIALGRYSTTENAAAECARFVEAMYSREVDLVQGQLKTNYSQKAVAYGKLAIRLDQRGYARGGVTAYVGGISIMDKANNILNTDRVSPQFNIGMFDNLLPESPVGHESGVGQQAEQDFITDIAPD